MSECVVRMEMPQNNCEMAVEIKGVGDWCPIAARVCDYYSTKKMPDLCPIICQLPEGHGRLMDADAFEKDVSDALVYGLKEIPSEEGKQIFHVLMQEVLDNVKKRESIVPAEAESPSPKLSDPLPIRGVEYVPTKVDVQTGTVTYELRERSET